MNKTMFVDTKWDVREWTDEMKQKWNSKVQELGFAGLDDDTLLKLWLNAKTTRHLGSDDTHSLNAFIFIMSNSEEKKYEDMFPEEKEVSTKSIENPIHSLFTGTDDIFTQMKTIAKENSMFISFDGLNEDEEDVIVVTHVSSDTEYVVNSLEEFNQLTQSFKALEKFERKI